MKEKLSTAWAWSLKNIFKPTAALVLLVGSCLIWGVVAKISWELFLIGWSCVW